MTYNKHKEREREGEERQTDRQSSRQTYRLTDADKKTVGNTEKNRKRHMHTCKHARHIQTHTRTNTHTQDWAGKWKNADVKENWKTTYAPKRTTTETEVVTKIFRLLYLPAFRGRIKLNRAETKPTRRWGGLKWEVRPLETINNVLNPIETYTDSWRGDNRWGSVLKQTMCDRTSCTCTAQFHTCTVHRNQPITLDAFNDKLLMRRTTWFI